jgi:hypothetical protein
MAERLLCQQCCQQGKVKASGHGSRYVLTINRVFVSYSPASISEEMPREAWARRSGGHAPRPGHTGAATEARTEGQGRGLRSRKLPAAVEGLGGRFCALCAALLSSMAARGFKIERSSANHRGLLPETSKVQNRQAGSPCWVVGTWRRRQGRQFGGRVGWSSIRRVYSSMSPAEDSMRGPRRKQRQACVGV